MLSFCLRSCLKKDLVKPPPRTQRASLRRSELTPATLYLPSMKHYSKVSKPLVIILAILQLGPIIPVYLDEGLSTAFMIFYVSMLALFVLVVHMMYNTTYTIEGTQLNIKAGLFSYPSVDIMDMKEISHTNTWLSSPAASFDRIAIKHGRYKKLIISPEDKHLLAAQLKEINPELINHLDQSSK